MKKVLKYITIQAIDEIRYAIQEAKGNEVFFVGKTNNAKVVEEIITLARGHQFAVPVVRSKAEQGDVVIHNHPSGNLNPSDNDLHIGHDLGELGIGSFIVNNEVTNIYVNVEPFDKQEIKHLNAEDISAILRPTGAISKKLTGYEYRPQQIEMVNNICEAFNRNKIAVVEAGTGVGKTLAYLLPAIYWAVNNKERCVVSTNTINLQEQLIKKDIPFLQSVLGVDFKSVLIKGRSNYVCLRKIAAIEKDPELSFDTDETDEMKTLLQWAKKSSDGSKADLNFIPKAHVWEKIAAESDSCTRSKCPHFKKCFVNLARREANKADIIVVNHHLFFSDLAVRSLGMEIAVLPPYNRLILDEAHHIEDTATENFGGGITKAGISRILGRLYRYREKEGIKGYLPILKFEVLNLRTKIENEKLDEVAEDIDRKLIPQIEFLESLNNEALDAVFNLIYSTAKNEFGEIKQRVTSKLKAYPWWTVVNDRCSELIYQLRRFGADLTQTIYHLESCEISFSEDLYSLMVDIMAQKERLIVAADAIEQVLFTEDEVSIRWIEIKPRTVGNIVRLRISPLEIAETMKKIVYEKFDTIIMTSATLTVSGVKNWDEFYFLSNRIGLNLVGKERLQTAILPAPFNYREQVVVGIPLDIPAPDDAGFAEVLEKLILKSIAISEGRAFILFTSYGLLNLLHSKLADKLSQLGITTLKQGVENRHRLLEKFKQDITSVLFATDSFWEGVDVPGEALESIIITKLPFKVPSEPIIEARIEAIQKRGGNPFMEYSVPQAVIKLKQGFGRLIRSKTDRGSVLILDKRIIEKFYGRIFIASLPDSEIVKGKQEQIFERMTKFFHDRRES